ncbi:hypothetical protein DIPPA_14724 [Diplonema papillatum]|nr:hypothetical protein DIPPA_14724 [Diplonema papillatum]|eukprot:gene784-1204_t
MPDEVLVYKGTDHKRVCTIPIREMDVGADGEVMRGSVTHFEEEGIKAWTKRVGVFADKSKEAVVVASTASRYRFPLESPDVVSVYVCQTFEGTVQRLRGELRLHLLIYSHTRKDVAVETDALMVYKHKTTNRRLVLPPTMSSL